MATLKVLSPATRTSTDFGLWGTVVASVAKSGLQPRELQLIDNTVWGVVLANGTLLNTPETAVPVLLIFRR